MLEYTRKSVPAYLQDEILAFQGFLEQKQPRQVPDKYKKVCNPLSPFKSIGLSIIFIFLFFLTVILYYHEYHFGSKDKVIAEITQNSHGRIHTVSVKRSFLERYGALLYVMTISALPLIALALQAHVKNKNLQVFKTGELVLVKIISTKEKAPYYKLCLEVDGAKRQLSAYVKAEVFCLLKDIMLSDDNHIEVLVCDNRALVPLDIVYKAQSGKNAT